MLERATAKLAVRMLPGPNAPLPPDPATAYILLRQIEQDVAAGRARDAFGPILAQQLALARSHLGEVGMAEARRAAFDFTTLAPK